MRVLDGDRHRAQMQGKVSVPRTVVGRCYLPATVSRPLMLLSKF
jgi:hypothetical protein